MHIPVVQFSIISSVVSFFSIYLFNQPSLSIFLYILSILSLSFSPTGIAYCIYLDALSSSENFRHIGGVLGVIILPLSLIASAMQFPRCLGGQLTL